jgi:serine/threonine protein kinase HipA of HipAB toxin-antitoxin module
MGFIPVGFFLRCHAIEPSSLMALFYRFFFAFGCGAFCGDYHSLPIAARYDRASRNPNNDAGCRPRHAARRRDLQLLVGNNDAHGKNFLAALYGGGPEDVETRLSPLYDIACKVYYPDLSREMAMKIGDQYSSERATPKDFEKLADEAGLAKPLVRRRLPEQVAALIRKPSENAIAALRS